MEVTERSARPYLSKYKIDYARSIYLSIKLDDEGAIPSGSTINNKRLIDSLLKVAGHEATKIYQPEDKVKWSVLSLVPLLAQLVEQQSLKLADESSTLSGRAMSELKIKVTRIDKRYHSRLLMNDKVIDEMACQLKCDIGYISREMLRWFDKMGGHDDGFASGARRRHIKGHKGKIWYRNQL